MPHLPRSQNTFKTLESEGDKQTDYNDAGAGAVPGLRLRVSPKGKRQWVLLGRRPGAKNKSRYPLGDLGTMTLKEARIAALRLKLAFKDGRDPVAEAEQRKAAAAGGGAPAARAPTGGRRALGHIDQNMGGGLPPRASAIGNKSMGARVGNGSQNTGNSIIGRSSSRVLAAPGGGSAGMSGIFGGD